MTATADQTLTEFLATTPLFQLSSQAVLDRRTLVLDALDDSDDDDDDLDDDDLDDDDLDDDDLDDLDDDDDDDEEEDD